MLIKHLIKYNNLSWLKYLRQIGKQAKRLQNSKRVKFKPILFYLTHVIVWCHKKALSRHTPLTLDFLTYKAKWISNMQDSIWTPQNWVRQYSIFCLTNTLPFSSRFCLVACLCSLPQNVFIFCTVTLSLLCLCK